MNGPRSSDHPDVLQFYKTVAEVETAAIPALKRASAGLVASSESLRKARKRLEVASLPSPLDDTDNVPPKLRAVRGG